MTQGRDAGESESQVAPGLLPDEERSGSPASSCGFCWPLRDPNEEDRANNVQHECVLDYTHDGDHRCRCGSRTSRVYEVLPDAMTWAPPASSLGRMKAQGWIYDGVMHLLEGVTLEEAQGGFWTFTGKIVDSEGNVLQESQDAPE